MKCVLIAVCNVSLLLSAASLSLAQPSERFNGSLNGGITITGNALGLSKESQGNGPGLSDGIGTFVTVDLGSVDDVPPNPSNPWFPGTTHDFRKSSSTARLRLPVGSTVLYAELVWSGSYEYVEDVSAFLDDPIQLSGPSGLSTPVMPDPTTAVTLDAGQSGAVANYYVRSADVTAFVAQEGPGFYAVMGVPATQNELVDTLQASGWALVVAYADLGAPSRTLRIAVDGRLVDESSSAEVVFSGIDVPTTGQVEGRLLVAALEGDANRVDDVVEISPDGGQAFVALSGPNNPVGNFFASQINDERGSLDSEGTFGDRNHDADASVPVIGGRQGWDVTGVALSQGAGHVQNGQSSATIRVSSTGDAVLLAVIALEVSADPVDPICGNGVVESGEACDDGNDVAGDGCESDCTPSPPPAVCGDGIVDPGEECDAGAENGFPDCACTMECALPSPESACGRINLCEMALDECLSNPELPDSDGDGETDATDLCPGTAPATAVDQAGCSLDQYCRSLPVATLRDRLFCRFSDWLNDEPFSPRDCRPTPDACAPAGP